MNFEMSDTSHDVERYRSSKESKHDRSQLKDVSDERISQNKVLFSPADIVGWAESLVLHPASQYTV